MNNIKKIGAQFIVILFLLNFNGYVYASEVTGTISSDNTSFNSHVQGSVESGTENSSSISGSVDGGNSSNSSDSSNSGSTSSSSTGSSSTGGRNASGSVVQAPDNRIFSGNLAQTPGLPNTGLGPDEELSGKNKARDIATMLAILSAITISYFFLRRLIVP